MVARLLLVLSPFVLAFPLTLPAAEGFDERVVMREIRSGVRIEDLVFRNSQKTYNTAYRVCPVRQRAGVKRAAILYVHWYDPPTGDSNRSQFLEEAVELARSGACSLLIDTLWSSPEWFQLRDRAKDRAATERQLARIKDGLNFLLSMQGIDGNRVAYVGHDFGGMSGATISSSETRVKAWAIQAATPRWSEWYLLGPPLPEAERTKIAAATAEFDPIVHVAKAKGSFLFQFANTDRFVPKPRAEEFFQAAPEPKQIKWYEADHGLNDQARRDRISWLIEQLKLR